MKKHLAKGSASTSSSKSTTQETVAQHPKGLVVLALVWFWLLWIYYIWSVEKHGFLCLQLEIAYGLSDTELYALKVNTLLLDCSVIFLVQRCGYEPCRYASLCLHHWVYDMRYWKDAKVLIPVLIISWGWKVILFHHLSFAVKSVNKYK